MKAKRHQKTPQAGSSDASSPGRGALIESVVSEVVRRRSRGEDLSDDATIEANPHLMPELGRRLRRLWGIQEALGTGIDLDAGSSLDCLPASVDGALKYLDESLPRYRFIRHIHSGGQGSVYEAEDRETGQRVAVKVLLDGPLASERHRRRFEREAEILSKLSHENVVSLLESGIVNGRHFLVMEFIEGQPIDDYSVLRDPSVRELLHLFIIVCRAVHEMHLYGVIHRDIKPSNLLVDEKGLPHVCDFGLAKATGAGIGLDEESRISQTGQVVGTLPYLSPEQVGDGGQEVDARTDVYSLGVVLFELLTGSLPYPADRDWFRMRSIILEHEPTPLREAVAKMAVPPDELMSGDLETVLQKALAKDKTRRYQSASALADDLGRCVKGDAVEAMSDGPWYLLRRAVHRHKKPLMVASAFVVLLVASLATITGLWISARHQRDHARAVAHLAHATLDRAVTQLDDAVRPLAGGTRVRDEILAGLAIDLERLRPLVESEVDMNDVAMPLLEKQGDIALLQGRRDAATELYRAFLKLAEGEAKAGDAWSALLAEARSHRKLAATTVDGEGEYRRAIELCSKAAERWPTVGEVRLEQCTGHSDLAGYLRAQGRREAAVEESARAVALARPMNRQHPGDPQWADALARALESLAELLPSLGRAAEAINGLEECTTTRREAANADPANIERRHGLMMNLRSLGRLYRDAGRKDESERALRESIRIGEYLITADPTVANWKVDTCQTAENLALQYMQSKRPREAAVVIEKVRELPDELLKNDANNPAYVRERARVHGYVGWAQLELSELEDAAVELCSSLLTYEELCAKSSSNADIQEERAFMFDTLARCLAAMKRQDESLGSYLSAYEIRSKLVKAEPTLLKRKLDLILSKSKLATSYLRMHNPTADLFARAILEDAEGTLASLLRSGSLAGQEATYHRWLDDIHTNCSLATKRISQAQDAQVSAVTH